MSAKTAICALIFFEFLYSIPALAVDEPLLCGVVQEVNQREGIVVIDVTSESCRGPKEFKLPPAKTKGNVSLNVGDRKCFSINSNSCKAGNIYAITNIVPE